MLFLISYLILTVTALQSNTTFIGTGSAYQVTQNASLACQLQATPSLLSHMAATLAFDLTTTCSQCALVTTSTGQQLQVMLLDQCKTCKSGDLQFPKETFSKLNATGPVKIHWQLVPCADDLNQYTQYDYSDDDDDTSDEDDYSPPDNISTLPTSTAKPAPVSTSKVNKPTPKDDDNSKKSKKQAKVQKKDPFGGSDASFDTSAVTKGADSSGSLIRPHFVLLLLLIIVNIF